MGINIRRLENEKDCRRAQASHADVMRFYNPRNNKMQSCMETLRGKIYSEKELEAYRETGRVPISINKALAPFRTIMGVLTSAMFDASFLPVGEEDQKLADVLSKLAAYEEKRNDDFGQNAQVAQAALAMGRGYRLCQVLTPPGERARIASMELNPYAVYFDPDSREVISRSDAKFVDVCHWLSADEIMDLYPGAKAKPLGEDDGDRALLDTFAEYEKSIDRRHESSNEWNGKYKVVERYYKVSKPSTWAFDEQTGEAREIDPRDAMLAGMPTMRRKEEYLYLAVWAPDFTEGDQFLFNGEYHVQPRDPDTKKIMFPVIELVSDNMLGESDGFIEFIKDPQKVFSVLYTQLIDAAKHSSGSYTMNPDAYKTPEEAERAKKWKALSNQVYEVKEGRHGEAMQPIPTNNVSASTLQGIAHIEPVFNEAMSSTPAMQGVSESKNTPASLNAQRVEQGTMQLASFFNFHKKYLTHTLKLRYAYWREKYTEEMEFRIFDRNNGRSEQVVLNQMVPVTTGWNGLETGELRKINDLQAAEFDVVIADSVRSPTNMKKQADIIGNLMQNGAVMMNPAIANVLTEWLIRVSDMPGEAKEQIQRQMQAQTEAMQPQNQINQQQPQMMAGMAV